MSPPATPPLSRRPPGRRALLFIFITVLIDSIGFGLIIPVIPQLIVELTGEGLGAAARYGGWLGFVYAGMQFFCSPILGNLSDRFGRRPVLLLSMFAFSLDYLVMGLAPTIGWLFLGRLLSGVAGATFTPASAYIADVTPPEKRAQSFGLIGAAFGVGFIVGPVIGGVLGEYGARLPFFAAAGFALINMVYGYFVLPETLPPASRRPLDWRRANPLGSLASLRRHPGALGLGAAFMLLLLAIYALRSVWTYYAIFKFDWSQAQVGYSLGVVGLSTVIVSGYLTRVAIPRLGERRSIIIGVAFAIVGYLGFAFAQRGWQMYAWTLVWSISGLFGPAIRSVMSQQVAADEQGELQGAISSMDSLSAVVSPPIMTQLFAYFSAPDAPVLFPGAPFVAAAALSLGALIVIVRTLRRPSRAAAAAT